MGSLSNLYISHSYTSLVHLGNDGPITDLLVGQYTELQDGLGNDLQISINREGDISSSANIYAKNISGLTDSASFNQFTASINSYTASTNIRLNNIEIATSSLNTSVSELNNWSASAKISISALNAFTASNSFSASIVQLNQFTQSANIRLNNLEAKTGSYATTGSNVFVGANVFSSSVEILGGLNLYQNGIYMGLPKQMGDPYDTNIVISTPRIVGQSGSGNRLVISGDTMTNKGVTILNGLGITGSVVISPFPGMTPTGGDLDVYGTFTASLQQGYVWVGNASGKTTTVATSSFVSSTLTGSFTTTSSFNAYTQSTNIRLDNLESTTASLNISVANINNATQSLQSWSASAKLQIADLISKTGSYATTGSNTFIGNQTINGNLNLTGSLTASGLHYPIADNGAKSFMQTDGAGNLSFQYVDTIWETIRNGESTALTAGTPVYVSGSNGNTPIAYRADASDPNKMPVTYVIQNTINPNNNGAAIALGLITGVTTTGYPAGTEVFVAEGGGWSANRPTGSNSIVQPLGIVTKEGPGGSGRGIVLNPGPVLLPNIQTGYLWVGDANNQPISVATSSIITNINTGSLVTTSSFNTYTASVNQQLTSLEAGTSSYAISSSVAAVDAAQQAQINSLIAWTGSVTSSTTIQSNGTTLGQATTLNFIGTGANVSVGAGTASITINAGSGSGGGTAGNSYSSTFMGSTWVVNHNLNTSVPLVFAYESGSQWVIPAQLDVTSPNSVTLVFSSVVSGSVVVVNGGDQTVISDVTNATSATITHNLNTDWPIVQVYESGSRAQIIPLSVVSDSLNQITIGFSTPTSAKVVIKK